MRIKGIDVSSYQGNINWQEVAKSGVEFAILKVIRKDLQPDKQFEVNYAGCTEAGLPVQGVYNYSYATTVEKAKTDAKRVVEILSGRKPMVWLDVEDKCQCNLGKTLIDIINEYGKIIKSAGCEFGVYTGLSFYNVYIKQYAEQLQYPFWIARYPVSYAMSVDRDPADDKRPQIEHNLYGWQYSSKGAVPGIKGNVDLNELYVAVETENVMPEPEATKYKVGDKITVSSYYASSTAPIDKALIKNASGTIMRIKAGTSNPYCFGKNGIAIGWCNDGDIRSTGEVADTLTDEPEKVYYVVKSGDTLSCIAKANKTTVAELQKLNDIKNVNRIYVKQRIRVK